MCRSVLPCVAVCRRDVEREQKDTVAQMQICVAVCCSVLHSAVVCCSVLQCAAMCRRVLLHCVAVCCEQEKEKEKEAHGCSDAGVCCSVLQYAAL